MTEKRFKIYDKETLDTHIEDTIDLYSDGTPKTYWFGENEDFCNLYDLLNELADENKQLKFKKDRYKRLSQIRYETINNRILTIREFINNCSDSKVKNTLKDLFYSEVNEYDLPKKYKELERENEQLKNENEQFKKSIDKMLKIQDIKLDWTRF